MATVPLNVTDADKCLVHGVGVAVGGVQVGALFPILDPGGGDPEERGAAQVDQQLLGVGERGVAPCRSQAATKSTWAP